MHSVYIHIPFCDNICSYCAFTKFIYNEKHVFKYLNALEHEIKKKYQGEFIKTLYIGGGTPSCLDERQLDRLLSLIEPYSHKVVEYTIEVNPESLDQNKIDIFNKYHINRISMGVQSSDNEILKSLNRRHTFEDVVDSINLLKTNNLTNISVDLMYSLPGQDMNILRKTLEDILKLDVPHISLYSLTIEENTVFYKRGIKPLDEDIEADMYEYIDKTLRENNYIHYEISNFSLAGYESRHNLGYWKYDDFLGISPGASGKIGSSRYTNTRNMNRYLNNEDIRDENLILSIDDMKFEHIMMSLRTIYGLDIDEFNKRYDCDFLEEYENIINNNKYLQVKDNRLICTNLEILNTVLLDFLR